MASLIPMGISAGASILSSVTGGKGAKKAAQQQAAALQAGVDEQKAARLQNQQNEQPFLDAGTRALTGQNGLLALLGMSGPEAQAAAIQQLKQSPQFTSQYDTGLDAINQSAAATGGLRGGNNALAESNFGAGLLNQVLGQQIGNVGGLVQLGSGTANQMGQFGQHSADSIAALLGQKGQAQATGTMGVTNAITGGIGDLGKLFGSGGIGSNLFGGSKLGSSSFSGLLPSGSINPMTGVGYGVF